MTALEALLTSVEGSGAHNLVAVISLIKNSKPTILALPSRLLVQTVALVRINIVVALVTALVVKATRMLSPVPKLSSFERRSIDY